MAQNTQGMRATLARLSDGLPTVGSVTVVDKLPRTVIAARDQVACETCHRPGGLLLARDYRGGGAICLRCARLDPLVFLPSADAALTRRARAAGRTVVVDWWNPHPVQRSRRGYRPIGPRRDRLGVLVELSALESAARRCLADPSALADRRTRDERRMAKGGTPWEDVAAAIRERFPGCPRADVIAYHTAVRCPDAVEFAVAESVRHVDADGDERRVAAILAAWRQGVIPLDE
jgi:hypothetical protein